MSETPQQPEREDADGPAHALHQRAVGFYVDQVEAFWVGHGLPSRTRRRLVVELEDSLHGALTEGASLDDILAADAHTLATEIATAEGISIDAAHAGGRANLRGLLAWAIGSATAMAALVWFFALDPIADFFYTRPSTGALLTSVILSYGICGALTLGAAAGGMSHYLRDLENTRATVALATTALAITCAVGVGVCVGIARQTNASNAPAVVVIYVLFVGALMTAGIAAAWRTRLSPSRGSRRAPGSGRARGAGRWLRPTMTSVRDPHRLAITAITAMGVLGGVTGYLLLVALAGGRYDFVGQCFVQADGLTTCMDSIPRSYWVDVTAAGIGALMAGVATYVVARRPGGSQGSLCT